MSGGGRVVDCDWSGVPAWRVRLALRVQLAAAVLLPRLFGARVAVAPAAPVVAAAVHDARVAELLAANNAEVGRRRAAEREARVLRALLLRRVNDPAAERSACQVS